MKQLLRTWLTRVMAWLGYFIHKIDGTDYFSLQSFLFKHLEKQGELFIVQIGANDGVSFDPIYSFINRHPDKIRGVLVEPMKDAFEALSNNYRNCPGMARINVAIHNSKKEMALYKVDPEKAGTLPDWTRGIASFNEDHHKLSGTPADCIIPETVECISFDELLDRFNITNIDALIMDTEGYDAEILLNLNFERVKPSVIRFEHGLASGIMSRDKLSEIVGFLNRNDYQIVLEEEDATAFQLGPLID